MDVFVCSLDLVSGVEPMDWEDCYLEEPMEWCAVDCVEEMEWEEVLIPPQDLQRNPVSSSKDMIQHNLFVSFSNFQAGFIILGFAAQSSVIFR
ncbi:hypothetical protein AVEN_81044-1 [Araneus ventricosus]|uniref:Uncharacterized protein n=1 Tax=Araneus ventricosus TaxID=182803 RepID=A0A4Y2JSF5_ARAVE|nr:hypothetical protein AVEN_81044-1 [Araneus ventricosus]